MSKKIYRYVLRVGIVFASVILLLLILLQTGMVIAHCWEPYSPDYEKTDIRSILKKSKLSDEEYETLYRQTGLTRVGVDGLLRKKDAETILSIQNDFFAGYETESEVFGPFVCWEKYPASVAIHMAEIEDGDILISPSTHFSCFRFGHAALVVDGKRQLLLNAVGYENLTSVEPISLFNTRSAFLILRPKTSEEIRKKVAAYARENLTGLNYSLTTGIFGKKYDENIKRTHCSHLIWYAYAHFGIDLDSNGGAIVLPRDIANSSELELVQAYGFDLDELWR